MDFKQLQTFMMSLNPFEKNVIFVLIIILAILVLIFVVFVSYKIIYASNSNDLKTDKQETPTISESIKEDKDSEVTILSDETNKQQSSKNTPQEKILEK